MAIQFDSFARLLGFVTTELVGLQRGKFCLWVDGQEEATPPKNQLNSLHTTPTAKAICATP